MDDPFDPDFNSSDLELDEPDREPFATRGKASLDSMLRSAVEDRRTSKLRKKSLKLQSRTPGVEAAQSMWTRRFRSFRENTLRVEARVTPDCDHLERFITTIVKHIRSRNPDREKNAVSLETISQGLELVTKHCVFEYKDFKLDRHDRFRLSSTVERMIKEGVVTREPARAELMWITWDIIHRMNIAILRDAIENGVLSWDYAIYKVLFLSFQCALACRVGDIMKTGLYESTVCLQYRDIKVKLLKQGSEERLWAVITLRALKGQKLDPKRSKIIEFGEVTNPDLHACCPIKILLIWAMRVGATSYSSWDQLLAHLRNQRSSTLPWTRPHFPIFCAMEHGGSRLFDFEKPAATSMGSRILSCGARLIGLLGRPITHDVRRGAARELSHLPHNVPGTNSEIARIGLGHTRKAQAMGITDDYVGHVAIDLFERRREARPDNLPGQGIRVNFADSAFVKSKKRKAATIDGVCARHSLDPTTRAGRSMASYYADKEEWDAWITDKKARLDGSSDVASNNAKWAAHQSLVEQQTPCDTTQNVDEPDTMPSAGADAGGWTIHNHKTPDDQTLNLFEPAGTDPSLLGSKDVLTELSTDNSSAAERLNHLDDQDNLCLSDDGDNIPIDPALQDLSDFLFIASGPAHDQLAARTCLSPETETSLPRSCAALSSDRATFCTFFSAINVTTAINPRSFVRHNCRPSFTGHTSRDEASKFRWPCPNAIFGCEKTFVEAYVANMHHGTCKIRSFEAHQNLINEQAKRLVSCSQCSADFFTLRDLKIHVEDVHFIPKKCVREGCSCQEVFSTKTALRKHVDQIHRGWTTKSCPASGCAKASHVFTTPRNLKLHLQKKHNFSETQVAPYIPAPRASPTFKRQRCSHPDCTTTAVFACRREYQSHAARTHGAYGDDYLLLEQASGLL